MLVSQYWCLRVCIYSTPRLGQNVINLLAEFNRFEFLLLDWLLKKAKELSLPCYLPISEVRIIGLIPFPKVLVLCEMQTPLSRIWNRVARFISYDSKHYTTFTSISPSIGVHARTSFMSFYLFLLQCLAYLDHLTWMVCAMGSKWPYSCCFSGFVQNSVNHLYVVPI